MAQQQKKADNEERACAIDLKIELQEKEEQRRHAEIRSNQDALTGLGNRYMLEKDAVDVIEHAMKTGEKIAVGVIDIDCFKQHNDKYGHIQGDRCLQHVADVLKNAVEKMCIRDRAIGYFERSADELEKVTDTENENFQIRYLITHMNLMKSYGELDRLDDARKELLKLEKCSQGIVLSLIHIWAGRNMLH